MITCDNCRKLNEDWARVCTQCGTSLWLSGRPPSGPINPQQRPPAAGVREPQSPYAPPAYGAYTPPSMPMQPQYAGAPAPMSFRCPYCQSTHPPLISSKISDAGWIVFAVMLLFCFPLFWIGLLMKEDQRICRSCGMKLS